MEPALTVLVIDDEPDHRTMVRTILTGEVPGVRVVEAADGREGLLRRRGTGGPLLVLCDEQMPLLAGHQAFLCICGRRRPDERWVAVSSDITAGQRAVLAAAGVDDVVDKPIVWDDMVAVVRRIVDDWRAHAAAPDRAAEPT